MGGFPPAELPPRFDFPALELWWPATKATVSINNPVNNLCFIDLPPTWHRLQPVRFCAIHRFTCAVTYSGKRYCVHPVHKNIRVRLGNPVSEVPFPFDMPSSRVIRIFNEEFVK
jgi:hypothetical protein